MSMEVLNMDDNNEGIMIIILVMVVFVAIAFGVALAGSGDGCDDYYDPGSCDPPRQEQHYNRSDYR